MNQFAHKATIYKNSHGWLLLILLLAVILWLGTAVYLGNDTRNWLGGTADQLSYDNLALRLLMV